MMRFNEKYNHENFLDFLNNFLTEDFLEKEEDIFIKKERYKEITKAKILGYSACLDLYILEMYHSRENNPRIAIATDAFKILADHWIHRALVIFKNKESENYRLSYLTISLDLNDKNKPIKRYSNAHRYSFYLGTNAKIRTPEQQLIKKGKVKDLSDLHDRFSLEVVNKEFYKEISKAFTNLVGGLLKLPSTQDKSQTNLEFAVRLIGRVIFCWFLREKKSQAGMALMPKELLSFEAVKKNEYYYHKILEPIFFEILNKPVKSRRDDFTKEPFSSVPYLNGGLFSPQDDDFYKRTNGDFQSQYHNTLVIPDHWFKDFFEILETYNFTIDENTSYDEELSIDPEMLGRIFENLLAEINPETGESARKSTGSYYTPRVIVNYMIDESLFLYLKEQTGIDDGKLRAIISYDLSDDLQHPITVNEKEKIIDALEKVKILDPACGSGAFPIGALQKIVFILQQSDPDGHLWFKKQIKNTSPEIRRVFEREFANKNFDYIRKLGIIRENIYGVDIQPIATEISRLRCFLTLIVDECIQESAENRGIEPLPNLDFKFVTANSLIGLPKLEDSQQTEIFDDREKIDALKYIRDQYFTASGIEREQLKTEFVMQQKRLVDQLIKEHGFMGIAKVELTQKLTNWEPFTHKSTPWFDPDWMFGMKDGFNIVIGNPPYITLSLGKKQTHFTSDYLKLLESLFTEIKEYKNNTFSYFIKKAYDLADNNGVISYIVPNVLLFNKSFSKVRKFMLENSNIAYILDIKGKVFETAEIGGNCVFVSSKDKTICESKALTIQNIENLIIPQYETIEQKRFNSTPDFKFYIDTQSYKIFEKLDKVGTKLSELCSFYNGIKTGDNKRFLKDIKDDELDELVLRGRDIQKYYINKPSIYVHFDKDKLWSNTNEELLKKSPKILVRQTGDSITCALDDSGYLHMDTTHGLFDIKVNIYYLVGLLNSKVISYWHRAYTSEKGRTFAEVKIANIKNIPIRLPEDKRIIDLTKSILDLKGKNNISETKALENEIDELVMSLYRLNEEEKKIIKNS